MPLQAIQGPRGGGGEDVTRTEKWLLAFVCFLLTGAFALVGWGAIVGWSAHFLWKLR